MSSPLLASGAGHTKTWNREHIWWVQWVRTALSQVSGGKVTSCLRKWNSQWCAESSAHQGDSCPKFSKHGTTKACRQQTAGRRRLSCRPGTHCVLPFVSVDGVAVEHWACCCEE